MTDNGKEVVNLEKKKKPTLEERLKGISEELVKIKGQIKQTDDQMVQNQRQLQVRKDTLTSIGLELQGQEKLLKDILGIKDVPEVPKVEAKKAEAPKEVIKPEAKNEEVKEPATPAPAK